MKQECYGNNSVLLESINEVGILANALINLQMNDSDKRGLSSAMGFDFSSTAYLPSANAGHVINANAAGAGVLDALTFEYSMPVMGVLGSGSSKMIPIGEVYGLRYELTVDNWTNYAKAFAGTNRVSGVVISEFEFVGNVIELSPEANALVQAQNPSHIRIRSQTYRQASNTLSASQSAGTNDLLVGIRVSSLKSIFMCCSPANAADGKYSGVNPNLDQGTSYLIGGQQWPQRGINPSGRPSDSFFETQKALGSLSFNVFNGAIGKSAWNISSNAYGQCAAYNATAANISTKPNQFFLGVDLEVISRKDNLLSGDLNFATVLSKVGLVH